MPTCRDIPPEVWAQARQALVFYFERRQRKFNAEDLAQETLIAVWRRDDFNFERAEDFLRVCHGFAGRVLKHYFRRTSREAAGELPPEVPRDGASSALRLENAEMSILLDEVLKIGRSVLRKSDWDLIEDATEVKPSAMNGVENAAIANKVRVRLSRARDRLARATGWRGSKTTAL